MTYAPPSSAHAIVASISRAPPSKGWTWQATFFWPWDERTGVVRWMCAFDTEAEDVTRFAATLSSALARHGAR
jgi:threonine aldolase